MSVTTQFGNSRNKTGVEMKLIHRKPVAWRRKLIILISDDNFNPNFFDLHPLESRLTSVRMTGDGISHPLIAWKPTSYCYAQDLDQPMNAKLIVEIGVALEVLRDDNGALQREDIARVIKDVICGKCGENLRFSIKRTIFGNFPKFQNPQMAQVSIITALVLALLASAVAATAQEMSPAPAVAASAQVPEMSPAPSPDAGAGFTLQVSGAVIGMSLLLSVVSLLRH
ncbi:hypothetical protein HAX54_025181 [Datura stramonium]|uniref:Transmembrane protein n=1 Tax=Datura stramonium TaxID=4076 RepID=A0ABS8V161_DATST|nr:hypothetical protein [Datura stramonium]